MLISVYHQYIHVMFAVELSIKSVVIREVVISICMLAMLVYICINCDKLV